MIGLSKASNELNKIKDHVIGIFKQHNVYSLVLGVQQVDKTVDLITVTNFGVLQQTYSLPIEFGVLHLFPSNKNMNDMLNDPFEWSVFMSNFIN